MLQDELDQTDLTPTSAPAVTRVPLHGPVDSQDVMCAKVIFALCGSVFPHPLLLAQQILGIEDQDFPEFQLVRSVRLVGGLGDAGGAALSPAMPA